MKKYTSVDPIQLRHDLKRFRHFSGMVDKPLDVYLVTPLLNFSFNEMYLNRISNDLSKHIRRSYKGVKGKLILLSKPPRLPCISVGVMADEEIIFCAQMLSLSIIPDGPRTHLPLMCIMLNKKVGLENRIKSFLEERFCCAINRCLLSDTLFQWIMGIAVNETLKRSINEGITITYAVYKTCIHYTLEPEELLALWDECTGCGSKGLDINWTSVEKFVLGVNEHFFNTFGLNNIEMEAERVNVEGISIARLDTLRMKVKDDGLLFVLLKFIEITRIKCSPYYSPINCG